MSRRLSNTRLCIAIFSVALVAACSSEPPADLVAAAKASLVKGDINAALVQAKGALSKNPDLAEGRFLLGKALLAGGDSRVAEIELRKAGELNHPADEVEPLLAEARLASGQFAKVVEDYPKTRVLLPESKADLSIALAVAQFALGKPKEAKLAVASALAFKPDHAKGMLVQARLKASEGDVDAAIAIVKAVVEKNPAMAEARIQQGELFDVKGDFASAIAAFGKAVELRPDGLTARRALLSTLLKTREYGRAKDEVAAMQKLAPGHPQVMFMDAMFAFSTKDLKRARESVLQALKLQPDNAYILQLAGVVEHTSGSYVRAEDYLVKAVSQMPDQPAFRRWLALNYVATGRPTKAVEALQPILGKIDDDPFLLALAGEIYLQLGDLKKGEPLLLKAAKLDPKDPKKRTSLAVVRLARGDAEGAFADLSTISTEDKGTVADIALLAGHLQRGETDKALKVLDVIEKKSPKDPVTHNIRGSLLAGKRDFANARKSYERALALSPSFLPAAVSLAGLDLADGKPQDALKRYEAVVAADPKSSAALLAMADYKSRSGASADEVFELINKAVAAHPEELAPRTALVLHFLVRNDPKRAIEAAQAGLANLPDAAPLLDGLGQAQAAAGDTNQALATFTKLANLQQGSAQPHLRIAEVHARLKNAQAASQSLRKALEITPDLIAAQQGLIGIEVAGGRIDGALTIAKRVQAQRPKEAVGYLFEGDIEAKRKDWRAAASAYRAGLKNVPNSTELALNLFGALLQTPPQDEADKFASSWLKEHPKDAAFRFKMGDVAAARGDNATAASHYRAVIPAMPASPALYNNLALVSVKLKEASALEYAEKANQIAPGEPAFMDTLAVILADKGDVARALELFGKAIQKPPVDPSIRVNFARALARAGRKDDARKQLEEVARLGDKFPRQAEVTKLMQEI